MKTNRIFISLLLILVSLGLSAQLKVESSTGKVNIGSYNNLSNGFLKLGGDGIYSGGLSLYDSRYAGSPFYIYRSNDIAYLTRSSGSTYGLKMMNDGQIAIGQRYHDRVEPYGARLIVASPKAEISFSVFGHPDMPGNGDITKVQVYKEYHCAFSVWLYDLETKTSRKTFFIDGTGGVWSNGQYIGSDASIKKNIGAITSPLEKLMQLRGVVFDSKLESSIDLPVQTKSVSDSITSLISPSVVKQINTEKKRQHMGVVAQEVEKVIPEVVRTKPDGTKAVAYHELVGLLIEAMKEQQQQIDDLKQQLKPVNALKSSTQNDDITSISSEVVSNNQLHQNVPNPFSSNTEIRYYLEEGISKANLYIYDMQGRQIKNIANLSRGDGSITVSGYELSPGMYIYTLIADGKEIGTKRMILTD